MPPKNKKQLEEQAKRLQEQQKRKQQEERKLQQQRKRYAAEILSTGLLLPVSNQLIIDFNDHDAAFISGKLQQVISKAYEHLKDEKVLKQLIKQMLYTIKDLKQLFGINETSKLEDNAQKYFKVRVCCGFYLSLFLNNHPALDQGQNKNKGQDENLLRRLLLDHSQAKTQKQQKVFSKSQIISILTFFKQSYFNHFTILHKHSTFPKRQDEKSFNLYIATPLIEFNTFQTTFIDLSKSKVQDHHSENQEKRSDALE